MPILDWKKYAQDLVETSRFAYFGTSIDIGTSKNFVVGEPSASLFGFFPGQNTGITSIGTARVYDSSLDQVGLTLVGEEKDEHFGTAVAINDAGDLIAVVSGLSNTFKENYAKIFKFDGLKWIEQKKIPVAAGSFNTTNQGRLQAEMTGDGEYLVIGNQDYDGGKGIVQIFKNNGGDWDKISELTDVTCRQYGKAISISPDDKLLVIGGNNNNNDGKVDIYQLSGGMYLYLTTLTNGSAGPPFGQSLSITQDIGASTHYLAVGSRDVGPSGHVYLYKVEPDVPDLNDIFTFLEDLESSDIGAALFGTSVALSLLASHVLLLSVSDVAFDAGAGKTYSYTYHLTGVFTLEDEFIGETGSLTGIVIRQTVDPITSNIFMPIGAPSYGECSQGAVYVRTGMISPVTSPAIPGIDVTFEELGVIEGPGEVTQYGRSVATNIDGTRLVVGMPGLNANRGGALFYSYNSNTKKWRTSDPSLIVDIDSDQENETMLGKIVDMSGDGTTIALAGDNIVNVYHQSDFSIWLKTFSFGVIKPSAISLSHDGKRLAVTEMFGPSYVYNNDDEGWDLIDTVIPPVPAIKIMADVSISGNGKILAVLTEYDDISGILREVSTYNVTPTSIDFIQSIDFGKADFIGSKVDLNFAGTRMVVGLVGMTNPSILVRVYEFDGIWYRLGNNIVDSPSNSTDVEVVLSNIGDRLGIYYYNPNDCESIARTYEFSSINSKWKQLGNEVSDRSKLTNEKKERMYDLSGCGNILAYGIPTDDPCKSGRVRAFFFGLTEEEIKDSNKYWAGVINGIC